MHRLRLMMIAILFAAQVRAAIAAEHASPTRNDDSRRESRAAAASADPFINSSSHPGVVAKHATGRQHSVLAAAPLASHAIYPYLSVEPPAAQAARTRIENELAKNTTFELLNESLKDILDDIGYRHAIPIWIDAKALEEAGVDREAAITVSLKDITLRSALRRMLSQLELTYLIRDELLQITTHSKARSLLVTKIYSVADLMPSGADKSGLVELIQCSIAPETWQRVGGPGQIHHLSHFGALAISQQEDVFPEVESLLAAIKQLQNKP